MRFRSHVTALLALLLPVLAACGGGEVTVRVVTEGDTAQQPVEDLVLTFLPYDRDSIFNVLTEQASEPEPQPPEDLVEQYEEVQAAQQTWREAESNWAVLRDSLKTLTQQMEGLDRRSREYLQLFEQYNELEGQERQLNSQKDQLFERFDSLQKSTVSRADSMEAVIGAWEEVAFEDYMDITDSILEARGVEIQEDTTGTDGYAATGLSGGEWWVYTRYQLPFEELYWNLRVDTVFGDTIILSRENAEVRRRM